MNYRITCHAIIFLATVECRATPLVLNESQDIYTPGPSMFILEDPKGALTIDEVSKPEFATRFTPCREDRPNFGFTQSVYWVRFTIHNQTIQRDLWLIEMLFANIHYVDFYRPVPDDTGYLAITTGVMRPVTTRDVAHHRFFFRLPLAPGDTQTVYLRVQNGASMTLTMQILTLEAYARKIRGEYLLLGVLLASKFMLGLYSAFIWHSLRDRLFLYYAFSMVGATFLFLAYSGIGFYYLWAGMPAINRYTIFWTGGIYGIIVLQFSIFFLEITRRHTVAFVIFRFLQISMLAVMTASLIIDYGRIVRLFNMIAIGGCLAAVSTAIMFRVKGFRPAQYYLLIMASGGIWIILLPLVRFGFVSSTFYTEHAVEIGSVGFSFVWAFVLMKRVTFLRQKQEQTFAALQDSEQKFRDIVKHIPGVVYQFRVRQDGSTYFSYASPHANDLFGLPVDLSGQDWELGDHLYPDDREAFLASTKHVIQNCTDWNYEGRVLLPDGSVKWFQGISSPTRFHDELVFNGILMDITERKRAEEQIRAALHEKENLLKEIHHRVKNNLQVISSLLNLQARVLHNEQDRALFQESQQRIRTMALIHEKLYQSDDLTQIDFREYVNHLLRDVSQSYGIAMQRIQTTTDIPAIELHIDTAIPCGLIINELVSNALKYAFPEGHGNLMIAFRHIDTRYQLMIQDDGVGLPESFDFNQLDSLGLQLVQGLVEEQLDGTFQLRQDAPGTCWCISFQEQRNKEAQS